MKSMTMFTHSQNPNNFLYGLSQSLDFNIELDGFYWILAWIFNLLS